MADFLLELLSEEIPARMQDKARDDLARLFADEIGRAGLKAASIETFATPRRLVLIARDLPLATEAVSEEIKGPRADAPEQALAGFLGKTGLTRDQLVERADAKGNTVLFAVIEKPGRATAAVLGEAIPAIVRAFPWPKSMRWGDGTLRWVRPLSGIVALLGEEIVPVEVDGIRADAVTVGHRFHHPGPVTIGSAADYAAKLRACHVIVDQEERRAIIRDRAATLAAGADLSVIPDEGLVAENAGLTEWPVPLLGGFDPAFLEVPREVIQLTMRTNQKYFACVDGERRLAPYFICTANIEAADGGAGVVAGNAKVLSARLSDARFFWEQDLKVPLADQAKKLDGIVFHEKLGTVAKKVERVAKLAEWLATEGIVPGTDPALARRAAELAKADLVTGMVGEFPELQGVMGGYIAAAQGEHPAVAAAIRDHYKPVGQGDDVPTDPVTVAVSLADKLDTLCAFFDIDEKPTGSKDPFALRRAGIAIIALIQQNDLRVRIRWLTALWQRAAEQQGDEGGRLANNILLFLHDRLTVQQRDRGLAHDHIAASASWQSARDDRLDRVLARSAALSDFLASPDGANLLAGYRRAANILRIEEKKDGAAFDPTATLAYDPLPEEVALLAALDRAEPAAAAAVEAERFEEAMRALAGLRAPIDAFFEAVTVNDSDPAKRAARLGLLVRIRDAVHRVADFSRIEG